MTKFTLDTKFTLAGNVGILAVVSGLYFMFPSTPSHLLAFKVAQLVAWIAAVCAGVVSWVLLAQAIRHKGAAWWALLIGAVTALIPLLVGFGMLTGM